MYRALTYPGDARELATRVEVPRPDAGTRREVAILLGVDAFGSPYEVLDVDVEYGNEVNADGDLNVVLSTVHLGPASTETRRGNRARYLHQRAELADQQREHARVRHFWRPDLWPAVVDEPAGDLAERLAATERAKGAA